MKVKQLLEVISKNKAKENELTEGIEQKIELCKYLENNLLDTKNKLEQAGNTIQYLKSNENTTIINLQKAIEALQREKAEMYAEYQMQIQVFYLNYVRSFTNISRMFYIYFLYLVYKTI